MGVGVTGFVARRPAPTERYFQEQTPRWLAAGVDLRAPQREDAATRADGHRDRARAALEYPQDHRGYVAVAEALLALEARLDELASYIARLG